MTEPGHAPARATAGATAGATARVAAPDGLRGLAAIGVFFFHLTWRAPAMSWALPVSGHLDTGVEIFFVLSALLVFGPFAAAIDARSPRPDLRRYLVKRAIRIWPGYLTVLGITMLVGPTELAGLTGFLKHASLTYLYFDDRGGTGLAVAWTLVVQVTFWALIPAAAWLLARLPGAQRTVVAAVAITLLGAWFQHHVAVDLDTPRWQRILPPALVSLGPGMLMAAALRNPAPAGRLVRWVRAAAERPLALVAVAATGFVTLVLVAPAGLDIASRSGDRVQKELLQAVIASCLVLAVAPGPVRTDRWNRFLGRPRLVWLGAMSFGFFLWHIPVLRWFRPWVSRDEAMVAVPAWGAALVVSLALAWATHHAVEQPCLRWLDRRIGRRATP